MLDGENLSFASFDRAIMTFYYMSTGEVWNLIMHDVMRPPACQTDTATVLPIPAAHSIRT